MIETQNWASFIPSSPTNSLVALASDCGFVDTAVPVDRLRNEALRSTGLNQVRCDSSHSLDSRQRVDRERTADDSHPLSNERMDDRKADPLASAGDDGDLTVQLEVHLDSVVGWRVVTALDDVDPSENVVLITDPAEEVGTWTMSIPIGRPVH